MNDLEKQLKALANKRRLAIVKYLKKNSKVPVSDIAKEIHLSFKSTSRHLAVLRAADIVDKRQVNLNSYYFLSAPLSNAAQAVLTLL